MIDKSKDVYVVVDLLNTGVMCQARSITNAHAVSLGFVNAIPAILPTSISWDVTKLEPQHNLNDPGQNFQYNKNIYISPMNEVLVTPEWIERRKLAIARADALWAWEVCCHKYLAERAFDFYSPGVMDAYLAQQLQESDPKTNTYAPGIIEWAAISQVSPDVAYQELKLRFEGLGLRLLRNHAMFMRYVRIINSINEPGLLIDVVIKASQHLFLGKIPILPVAQ